MLSFETIGPSDGEPLVFLHGLGASRTKTTSALNNLPDLHLIAPDLPGHGDSMSFDPATYSFDSFADHTIALMDHLGLEKCHLGGLSMVPEQFIEEVQKLIPGLTVKYDLCPTRSVIADSWP